jgi:hypothetical protein
MDHSTDAHAPHSHGHAHTHDHHHDHSHDHAHGGGEYYLQQLLTVFICGAFGVAGVLMYTLDKLQYILAPAFHMWVLIGSGLLLFMTAVRGVALWQAAGAKSDHDHHHHDHGHAHGEDCGHGHKPGEACAHGHHHHAADHTAADHDHGNIYWRVVVLAFPVVILVMGLPNPAFSYENQGFSLAILQGKIGKAGDVNVEDVADKGDGTITSDFDLLATIAFDPAKREVYTGTKASITGQMEKLSDKQFRLFKMKMTCCSADMIPLQARAIVKSASQMGTFSNGDKIEVRGTIQFAQDSKSGEFLTVLKVDPADGIRPAK